ncbi:MAG: UvrD-helicase domain-containing protein, partial [Polyangiales bacterium]
MARPEPPTALHRLLHFERNVVLRAGAGTGKTEALTRLYLHLVTGMTAAATPLSPSRIVAVTFTRKAAAEMRARIQAGLETLLVALDRGAPPPEGSAAASVWQSTVRQGRPLSDALLRQALGRLRQAPITTFDAYCMRLLQRHAAAAGLVPGFTLLEPELATQLIEESVRAAVLSGLAAGDSELGAWQQELGGLRQSRGGLLQAVIHVWHQARSQGVDVAEAAPPPAPRWPTSAELVDAWARLRRAHEQLQDDAQVQRGKVQRAKWQAVLARLAEAPWSAAGPDAGTLLQQVQRLDAVLGSSKLAQLEPACTARLQAKALWLECAAARRSATLWRLLRRVHTEYSHRKATLGAVDFADLLQACLRLLRHDPQMRVAVAADIDALVVDEFQDTNALQRDLVYLLRARPDCRALQPGALDLQPQGLLLVGDHKQSIYAFRGADVAVFAQMSAALVAAGADELVLQRSYRSTAPLVRALNALSVALLGEDETERYLSARDDLEAVRPASPASGPVLEWHAVVHAPGQRMAQEAACIAARAQALAQDAAAPRVHDGDQWRQPRYGDMALLLPRLTQVGHYLSALHQAGVPYTVVNDPGLLASAQAHDLLAMMALLLRDDVPRATVTLLRSMAVGLSDAALAQVAAVEQGPGGSRWQVLTPAHVAGWPLQPGAKARVQVLAEQLPDARRLLQSDGLHVALAALIAATGYDAVLAGLPQGSLHYANLQQLLQSLATAQGQGLGPWAQYQRLRRWQQQGVRQPQADLQASPSALQVMTIHQAKGLQFPIVFAAGLSDRLQQTPPPSWLEPHAEAVSFAHLLRPAQASALCWPPAANQAWQRRVASEHRRLVYVQLTRARDHLVLVGGDSGTMRRLAPAAEALAAEGLLQMDAPAALATDDAVRCPRPAAARMPDDATMPPAATAAVPAPPQLPPAWPPRCASTQLHLDVRGLEDFALCPRRYQLRVLLRVDERPARADKLPAPLDDAATATDPRARGSAAHAILERLDWQVAARAPQRALSTAARQAGVALDAALQRALSALLGGAWVHQMATRPSAAIWRELPFTWRCAGAGVTAWLRGRIDLVVQHDSHIDIIDYKLMAARPEAALDHYRWQLSIYAAALSAATAHALPIHTALFFLDGHHP